MCTYIYIYIYIHIHMYIYVYRITLFKSVVRADMDFGASFFFFVSVVLLETFLRAYRCFYSRRFLWRVVGVVEVLGLRFYKVLVCRFRGLADADLV